MSILFGVVYRKFKFIVGPCPIQYVLSNDRMTELLVVIKLFQANDYLRPHVRWMDWRCDGGDDLIDIYTKNTNTHTWPLDNVVVSWWIDVIQHIY